jgi:hypothetical protein
MRHTFWSIVTSKYIILPIHRSQVRLKPIVLVAAFRRRAVAIQGNQVKQADVQGIERVPKCVFAY